MNPSTAKVLNELRRRGSQGVTVDHFNIGFRLAARIKDLRDSGNEIRTAKETVNYGTRGRYFLISEAKKAA